MGTGDGTVRRADAMARIAFATDDAGFAGVDFVIENVTEDWDVKRRVYAEIDALCPPHCGRDGRDDEGAARPDGQGVRRRGRLAGLRHQPC
jgi:hypothetical protein